ncbi:hypothetical protein [uncultured Draconibacterium sp.]|uniref:hypothetical protein n=1 Tax=uncultured Draconibacterium sp. TaxID=1573823 RepID=UPI0025D928BD|nr:hypothetical protein [uncultured Draconibacterium sp.]
METLKNTILLLAVIIFAVGSAQAQKLTPEDLNNWTFLGQGTKMVESHNQFFMKEDPMQSNGVMIVSPESYGENVVIKYDVMSVTTAGVLVAILSASNPGEDTGITIPKDYDGSMSLWIDDVENYLYAFRNGPHNFTPFIRKYPCPAGQDPALISMEKNFMHPGVYYSVEIGRKGNLLWCKVDGETILETTDKNAFGGGHIAFRIRGTAGEYAACLIRNVEIIK